MNVKIFDLARDHEKMKDSLVKAFEETLLQGDYILGKDVSSFESAFASYVGAKYSVGVGNGTDALRIAGLALGLKPGDKIVTVPNSYVASAMALSAHGIVPAFCDIERDTYNIDPEKLEDLLKKEKGVHLVVPIHLYGHPYRVEEVADICKKKNIPVLEDACQAHGALYKGKKAGTFGDASAFSFYPTKNLGAYGDGGAVVTNSDKTYERAVMLRNYGQSSKHVHDIDGFNTRLDEVQAKLLSLKLAHLDDWNAKRREHAALYTKELQGLPLTLPKEAPWARHVYHLYVIRSKERDALRQHLADNGVSTLIHYPTPIHLQKVYSSLGYRKGSFPEAEIAADEIISLPMYPSLYDDEILYVCEQIRKFYTK